MNIHHCYIPRNVILAAVLTIGFASSGLAQGSRAVLVDLNSKEVTYPGILPGGFNSRALGINEAGQVVGQSDIGGGGLTHAFITGPNGVGMTDLGTLGGRRSIAYGINDAGQVVGRSYATGNQRFPGFITGPNGVGMTDLVGTLGGGHSVARGINDAGQVVGINGAGHAFITGPNGVGMTGLGTLGGDYSYAFGLNDAGQVVGVFQTGFGARAHAFITGPDGAGMTELDSLVDPTPSFIYFNSATAINNYGQVAAAAEVPEPDMYAMLLLGLGLIGFLARGRTTA